MFLVSANHAIKNDFFYFIKRLELNKRLAYVFFDKYYIVNVKRKTFSLGQIKISDILTAVLRAVRQHHVKMEADFVNTVISILLLEGIGRQLDPNLDLFKSALPILRQLGRQMSTQENITQMQTGSVFTFLKVSDSIRMHASLSIVLMFNCRYGSPWKHAD